MKRRGHETRTAVLSFLAVACLTACGGEPAEPPSAAPPEPEPAEAVERSEAPAEPPVDPVREALASSRTHLDLMAHAHLADGDRGGLYIDFGTPARHHATMGRWHSGWGRDVASDGRDFTRMGPDARVFLTLDAAGPLTLRFRLRPVQARRLVVYVNGRTAGEVTLAAGAPTDVDVPVEAELTHAGENVVRVRAPNVAQDGVACEVDALWAFRGAPPADPPPAPLARDLVREVEVGGEARRALVLGGGTRLRSYLEVPPDADLALSLGKVRGASLSAAIRVRPEGGQERELLREPLTESWSPRLLPLDELAGQVVRLELEVEGAGRGAFAAPTVLVPRAEEPPPPEAPAASVILLLIDTLRASKLQAYNPDSRVQTPALDAFAAEGALFERAQSPENWTKPAVASVLASLSPMSHRTKSDTSRLPDRVLMLSEVLDGEGFATGSFIANGYVSDRFGFDQGWDHYTNYIREERRTEAERVFGEALRWIEAHREERFFAYIQTIDPHVPYDPPEDLLALYDAAPYEGRVRPRRTGHQLGEAKTEGEGYFTPRDRERLEALHDGEITYHDRHFGPFLERLAELGLREQVLFVITSDHGEEFHEHGSWGHGHSVYQELLHVPLLLRWPGVIPTGRLAPTVSTLDIAPTVLEALNVAAPEAFEGRSLLSMARGVPRPGPAVAFSDKLDDRRVVTGAGFKLVVRGNLTWSLFNLQADPGEQNQIDDGSVHPVATRYLRGLIGQYLGAADRGAWLEAGTEEEAPVVPGEGARIDAALCRQLERIDYILPGCEELL
ncbi:MAG: sulfatase [Sandaracinaceae bacterium]